ncbi:MAG: PQQ-binding-like beta-propeller repeat protein [Pirellula sp.]
MRHCSISILLLSLLSQIGCNSDTRVVTDVQPAKPLGTRTQGDDWPRMLGTNYDQRSQETGILTKWPPQGLKIVWTKRTGTGYGNGVASQGRWFQFDRFGGVERLSCLNAETGDPIWEWDSKVEYFDSYGYNNGPRCSPVVDGERVYVYGVAGTLACISVQHGKQLWKKLVNEEYHVLTNFFGVGASPVVYQDKLLVMVGGSPGGAKVGGNEDILRAKPTGTAMVAFDKITGKELYRVGNYLASYSAPVIRQVDGKDTCLALVREGLLAFDPNDGSGEVFYPWRAAMLESVNASSPIVWNNKILISECYEIGCSLLSLNNGKFSVLYKDGATRKEQLLRSHWSTPLLHENMLIGSNGRNQPDTDLRCLDLSPMTDGGASAMPGVTWTVRNRDRTTGLIVDSHALLLGETGLLQLIELKSDKLSVVSQMHLGNIPDPTDGTPLVEEPSWAPPVLSHGLVYVRGANRIVCLELIPQ